MSTIRRGERIGKEGALRVGASALIFDEARDRILMTQRSDNSRWCLPGGGMDPGESASETCIREVMEETGLQVQVTRLIGVYTTPDMLIEYLDGNKIQPVSFSFEAEITGGELGLSDETIDFG
jgi:8-oxo-dGTP pyrophosphatase MutT (NUDIX family)